MPCYTISMIGGNANKLLLLLAMVFVCCTAARAQDGDVPEQPDWDVLFSDEVCGNVCFPRTKGGLFTCHQECRDEHELRLPTGMDFLVKKVRNRMAPPMLDSVDFVPETPAAGEKFEVRLIPEDDDLDVLTGLASTFVYNFDSPGEWMSVRPGLDPVERYWKTEIEAPADAEMFYSAARIGDADGNTFIEAGCETDGDECFFPLSEDESYGDVEDFYLDPNLDILDSSFAVDEARLYLKIKVRGEFRPGELIPLAANYYVVGLYDPYRPTDEYPYHRTAFILYSPFLNSESFLTQSKLWESKSECKVLSRAGARWTAAGGAARCDVDGGELRISVKRKSLPEPVAGVYVFWLASGVLFDDDNGVVTDYTPTTAVRIDRGPVELSK